MRSAPPCSSLSLSLSHTINECGMSMHLSIYFHALGRHCSTGEVYTRHRSWGRSKRCPDPRVVFTTQTLSRSSDRPPLSPCFPRSPLHPTPLPPLILHLALALFITLHTFTLLSSPLLIPNTYKTASTHAPIRLLFLSSLSFLHHHLFPFPPFFFLFGNTCNRVSDSP